MRILDWEDWRFHWPGRYRDVFRQPQAIFVGEELPLDDPVQGRHPRAKAVWLAPPADMGRPVWRDVLEQTQLGPSERAEHLVRGGGERRRTHRLWGRIAAKEAARRIWQSEDRPASYPADLAVVTSDRGQPRLIRVNEPANRPMPAISIAHAEGVAVALAGDPAAQAGIDVEMIADRPEGFETSAFTPAERTLLDRWPTSRRAEWIARFWCAKEAAAKATGLGLAGGPAGAEVVRADEATGVLHVNLGPDLLVACPSRMENPLRVVSARRGEYAWAWALGEGAKP
jgi:phosphopantetheinyl transferase